MSATTAVRRRGVVVILTVLSVVAASVPANADEHVRDLEEACPPEEVPAAAFTDTAGQTHAAAIDCVAWYGMVRGVGEGRFAPGLALPRDQLASMVEGLLNAADTPLPDDPPSHFTDVDPSSVHAPAIDRLAEGGVVAGRGEGIYEPARRVRRDQLASILHGAYEAITGARLDGDEGRFTDTEGNVHDGDIAALAEAGIVAGVTDTRFAPGEHATRAQFAAFLARLTDLLVVAGHIDRPTQVAVERSVVADGLDHPWDIVFTDAGTAFVSERDRGIVREITADGDVSEVTRFDVNPDGEGGLLGLALHPDDRRLYAYLTTDSDNRVVRVAEDGAREPIVTGIPRSRIHNGGRIAFGPDGMLWITTGDANDPSLSPDPSSLAGKVLRVTPDGATPDDNPADSRVYASGIRNAQGLAWDDDGGLIISEFGPGVDDAVLRVAPGSDQGWGPERIDGEGEREFPDPISVKQPPEASWSGIAVLRDGAVPQWEGDLFVAALRGERLWRFEVPAEGPRTRAEVALDGEGRLRHVAQAPDGALWIATDRRADGDRILRLGPAE